MLAVHRRIPGGQGLAAPVVARAARVELPWDLRCRSRFDATDTLGRRLAVVLPRGRSLRGGDVLVAEDGSLIVVEAAPEPLLRVEARAAEGAALDLMRATYHLANRHVPLEIRATHLQLEPDPVLAQMLRGMDLSVREVRAPFEPEAGAYGAGPAHHAHGHADGHGHGHEHGHDHRPTPP